MSGAGKPAGRFAVRIDHGEGATVYSVMDTWAPDAEQPAVIRSWSTAKEPSARYLAYDYCARHNAKEGAHA